MASTTNTSLPAEGPKPVNAPPKTIGDYDGLARPPHLSRLPSKATQHTKVEPLSIKVEDGADGSVAGFLHLPPNFASPTPETHHRTAAILLSGAGGGVTGPSSIYLSLAAKLAALGPGIPALCLDYRYPARNRYCVRDVKAAMDYLQATYGLDHFVLVGWSFGGAPVFTVGGSNERVVGCATVASQTAETEGIRRLAPRPVLLLHGTAEVKLSQACSQRLYAQYGTEGNRQLRLFDGDNHALSVNAPVAETMLLEFTVNCAGLRVDGEEEKAVVDPELVEDSERMALMRKGGDSRAPESME
ncbi:Uu.00g037210.m01.CDS01 [Anthostomella pinea]|uniref:Uu.00g037210.m01.CDS01 n=1 Tax=Anthostomella pinea TaxID=933095 RepID=A0AAI8YDR9_9PEZI|nr:Uu.00g037210.m01.CDS01 [Anthostomella pinea]